MSLVPFKVAFGTVQERREEIPELKFDVVVDLPVNVENKSLSDCVDFLNVDTVFLLNVIESAAFFVPRSQSSLALL